MAKLIDTRNLGLVDGVSVDNANLLPLYGTCTTATATAAKVVVCASFGTLRTGANIRVLFANDSHATSENLTLNVNGTGAKTILVPGETVTPANLWRAGDVVDFVYDGSNWVAVGSAYAHGTSAVPLLGESWTQESSGLYSTTVTIASISADDIVMISPKIPVATPSTGQQMQDAWNLHYTVETVDGGLKFYATEVPQTTVAFNWAVLPR